MTQENPKTPFLRTDRGKFIAVVSGAVLLIGGSFGVNAIAGSKTFQHLQLAASDTSAYKGHFKEAGWSRGHHRRGGFGRLSEMSDAEIEKKITRAVKHVSIEIDATPDQEAKITTLITAVAKDMKPMSGNMRAAGKQVHELLLKDAIDRNALEKLRAERLAEIDTMSKNITNALADVAEVLTIDQRKTLDKRIEQFRSMRGHGRGWGRGWNRG